MPEMIWSSLANAIAATGSAEHVDCLMDLIGSVADHDLITVARYSASQIPQFVKHRQFSDEMVRKYLDKYYVYDPFFAYWRRQRLRGVVPLRRLADDGVRRGKYIAEFLAQSHICDEVGVLLDDGGDWCLGIFLDRASRPFKEEEIARLEERFPVFASLHSLDMKAGSDHRPSAAPVRAGSPKAEPEIPPDLWPQLSSRERELVHLILSGHPTATLARRLGITIGTVKNHRRRIYEKLDITTERELFLQYFAAL